MSDQIPRKPPIDGGVEMTLIKWMVAVVLAAVVVIFVSYPVVLTGMVESLKEGFTGSPVPTDSR